MIEELSSIRRAITPPAFDDSRLHRDRLVSSLLSALDHKLVVVVAAPGYGKSVLMADFVAHADLPFCWLELSEADQDPMRLAMVLKAALQRRFRRLRNKPDLQQFSGSPPEALARALIAEIEAHIPERFVFVLDDVHLLNASTDALKLIDTLILESPGCLTFLAAGRALPEISISRLIVNAQMFGIGADALALTEDEVVAIVAKSMNRELEQDQVHLLLAQTEGWIPGVLLIARSITNDEGDVAHGRPLLHEFLLTAAYKDEPADLREFMLKAAVLPEMTSTSCDMVLERDDSQKMLERISRKGLFITTTEGFQKTFVFHDLYRNFLADTLKQSDPELQHRLNTRAAEYYVFSGDFERAILQFTLADKTDRAASLAETHAREMFEVGRIKTLAHWAHTFKVACDKIPNILLYLATAYADIGELEDAKIELDKAISALESLTANKRRKMLARVETVRGWIAYRQGNYRQVLEAVAKAEKLLPRRGARVRRAVCFRLRALAIYANGGDLSTAADFAIKAMQLLEQTDDEFTLANVLLDLSRIRSESGDHSEGYALGMRAFKIHNRIGSQVPLANCLNNLAVLKHLEGHFNEALEYFRGGLQKAHQTANQSTQAVLLYGQADLFCDLGLSAQAGELYSQGLSIATQLEERQLIFYGFLGTAILHRRWGTSACASEWLKRAERLIDDERKLVLAALQRGALQLKQDPEKVELELIKLDEQSSQFLSASDQVFLHYILSMALDAQGKSSTAADQFQQALDRAGVHGMEQILAAELFADRIALKTISDLHITHPVLTGILNRNEVMKGFSNNLRGKKDIPDDPKQLNLRALGVTQIHIDGRCIIDLEPLPRQVLFYIAAKGPVSRDVLLEDIWPGTQIDSGLSSLYNATHSLRTAIMDNLIRIEGNRYQINPEISVKYDIHDFEQVAEVADKMAVGDPRRFFALGEALNAYKGSFLPEFSMDWVLSQRRVLERRYLHLLDEHASEALARGKGEESALESLRKALSLDPFRDDLNMRFLRLLGQMGRRSEAVSHYQQYRRLLAKDLGIDPSSEMMDLYDQILQ